MDNAMKKPLTGRKVLFIIVSFFGVIMSVNFYMAYRAISTFPGLESQHKYIAGKGFHDQRAAQIAMGWTVDVEFNAGELQVVILDKAGNPAGVAKMSATVGRLTHAREDQTPQFQQRGGKFLAPLTLAPGQWNLRMEATAYDSSPFRQRLEFYVDG